MHHTVPRPRGRAQRRIATLAFVAFASTALATASCSEDEITGSSGTQELLGTAVAVGNGTARTFVVDSAGRVAALGIELSEAALDGLPTTMTAWMLPLPSGAAAAPWDHAELDWNPQGHPPPHVYDVPHFDFHFYEITPAAQAQIQGGPDTVTVPAQFVPTDYASQIESVPNMGVHWADTLAAEYHGHPFDRTFIYGFSHGRMAFVEPMVTRAFLESHPDVADPVKQATAFQTPGLYPTRYGVSYDAGTKMFRVVLLGLTQR